VPVPLVYTQVTFIYWFKQELRLCMYVCCM
jgi:hypothetical protein